MYPFNNLLIVNFRIHWKLKFLEIATDLWHIFIESCSISQRDFYIWFTLVIGEKCGEGGICIFPERRCFLEDRLARQIFWQGMGKCDGSMNILSLNFFLHQVIKWQNWRPTSRSSRLVRTDDKTAFVETLSFLLCRFWLKLKLDIQQIQRFVRKRFSYFNMISNERKFKLPTKFDSLIVGREDGRKKM